MRHINPEHIAAILKMINRGPYLELLEIRVCELGIGYARLETDLHEIHYNPFGAVHGGVYSSVIDTATYWAVYCELEEQTGFTTIDLSVNNLSALREGKVFTEGKSIKIGHSICLAEATVKDSRGKLLAYGTSKLMILNADQSVENAFKAMGYDPLPPKFTA